MGQSKYLDTEDKILSTLIFFFLILFIFVNPISIIFFLVVMVLSPTPSIVKKAASWNGDA